MKLTIRPYNENDFHELNDLFGKFLKETFVGIHINERSFKEETMGEVIWLAMIDNKIVAFISIWEPDKFVHHLYVNNDHQGRGIGYALVKKMIDIYKSTLQLKCLVNNSNALKFYTKNNFKIKDEGVSADGPYYLLERNINNDIEI